MARQAGCHAQTIRRRLGKELPAERQVAYPRKMWGFAPAEAKQIAAWVKLHRRGRQGRRPSR